MFISKEERKAEVQGSVFSWQTAAVECNAILWGISDSKVALFTMEVLRSFLTETVINLSKILFCLRRSLAYLRGKWESWRLWRLYIQKSWLNIKLISTVSMRLQTDHLLRNSSLTLYSLTKRTGSVEILPGMLLDTQNNNQNMKI